MKLNIILRAINKSFFIIQNYLSSTNYKMVLTLGIALFLTNSIKAQYTYIVNQVVEASYPGGLNTDGESTTTGWTVALAASQAANSWSPVQTLPFPFDFYGTPVTGAKISGNGVMTFTTTATAIPVDSNTNLPAPAAANIPDLSILGFWDSFTGAAPVGSNDQIWVKTFGTAPNRQFWVKYYSYEYGSTGTGAVSSYTYWSIALEETTNKVYVVDYKYNATGANLTTTVGVQKDATSAVQWGTNTTPMAASGGMDYYEFTPILLVNDNAGIASLDAPASPLTTGSQNVDITLKNYGTNALDSCLINWSVNGVTQTPYNYTGPSLSTDATTPITLGAYNFLAGNSTILVWTSVPNGTTDGDPANDSLSTTLCTSLSGTFTIGASGDYTDVVSAANDLNSCGISGAVTFNIDPGTYTGEVYIGDVVGSSVVNTITFNGGSAAGTIITYDGANTLNATVTLDGSDYVTFENVTIENTEVATNGWGLHLTNQANFNTIDNSIVKVDNVTTNSLFIPILASGSLTSTSTTGDNANNTTISNTETIGGYYGVRIYGQSTAIPTNVNNKVENCTITDAYYYGIYFYYQGEAIIKGNTVNAFRNTFNYGIYSNYGRHGLIEGNSVVEAKGGYGIYMGNENATISGATMRSNIVNNMLNVTLAADGIYLTGADNVNVYHNTAKAENDQALWVNSTSDEYDIRNNIFVSDVEAVDFDALPSATEILDYNIYFRTTAGNLALATGAQADLFAWQTSDPAHNMNSIEGDPSFLSATDLHVNGLLAYNTGDNSVGVLTDIDGDTRPMAPSVVVNIGADEYFLAADDAGVSASVTPSGSICNLSTDVIVELSNFGLVSLTSATINWTVNGTAQTPFNWTGSLVPFGTENITIATAYTLPAGIVDFVFYTSMPNGSVDLSNTNDTLSLHLYPGMSGTYTIDAALPVSPTNFVSIDDAITALTTFGICSAVELNIAAGIYTGAIELSEVVGASAVNTVTFNGGSAAATTLTYDGSGARNATVTLNGADYITFKNVTIENTESVSNGWGLHLTNEANFNTLDSSIVNLSTTTTSGTMVGVLISGSLTSTSTTGNNANNTTISNTEINGGYYGVRFYGQSSAIPWNTDNKVENCTITDAYYYGIYYYYQGEAVIKGNTINPLRNTFTYGLYSNYGRHGLMEGNTVVGAPGGYALYMGNENSTTSGATLRSNIINNMLVASLAGDGIYLIGADNVNIFHNTAKAENDQALWINSSSDEYDIRNNVFISDVEVVDFDALPSATEVVDYNVYYRTTAGNLALATGAQADLVAWQTSDAAHNMNSLEGNPQTISGTDLHLLGTLANNVGTPIAAVTVDIDGDTRSATPDIGADEFSPATCFGTSAQITSLIDANTAEITWVTGGASNWIIEWGLAGFTLGTGNVMLSSSTTDTISGLLANTDYEWYVRDSCSASDLGPWSAAIPFFTGYCSPSSSTANTYINNFSTTNGVANISNLATGYATGGYADYYATNFVSVEASTSFDFNLELVGGSAGVAIWIDWNNDLAFDISERVYNFGTYTNGPVNASILIPLTVAPGDYRMRTLIHYNATNPDDACATNTRLESEDYKITVLPPPPCPGMPSTLGAENLTFTSADLTFVNVNSAVAWVLEWDSAGFTPGTGTSTPLSLMDTFTSVSGLIPNSFYEFYVRDYCGAADSSAWAGPFQFYTGYCLPSSTSTLTYIDNFTTTNGLIDISNLATGYTTGGYADYSATNSLNVEAGSTFDFSTTILGGTVGSAVWIDWNNDLQFDASERFFNTTLYDSGPFTGSITVPAAQMDGDYAMRVMIHYNASNPTDPCASNSRLEVEDYTVSVITCNVITTPTTAEFCNGDSLILNTGEVVKTAGMFNDTISAMNGCDSVLAYTVSVLMPTTSMQDMTICQGTPLTLPGGTMVTMNGTYEEVYINAAGCDSTVTYNVTVNVATASSEDIRLCDGATFTLPLSGAVVSLANTYVETTMNSMGCDSVITYNVTTGMSSTEALAVSFCTGDSVMLADGSYASAAGTMMITTMNTTGCDNEITYTVTENMPSMSTMADTICEGDSYMFDGQARTMTGDYTDTLMNTTGCDSVVTLMLTVNATSSSMMAETICEGESFMFAGAAITMTGSYTDTLMNTTGCDSIVTLMLTVNATSSSMMAETICEGESFTFAGTALTMAGDYTDTLMNTTGCDSVITLTIMVSDPADETITASICAGSEYTFGTQVLTAAGVYTETFTNDFGCEYDVELTLSVNNSVSTSQDVLLCGSDLEFVLANGTLVDAAGIYTVNLTTVGGCDSTVNYNVSTCVGIFDIDNNVAMTVYPNPTKDLLNVVFADKLTDENNITVVNVLGQDVYSIHNLDEKTMTINTSAFTSGIYYLHVTSDNKVSVKSFTVAK